MAALRWRGRRHMTVPRLGPWRKRRGGGAPLVLVAFVAACAPDVWVAQRPMQRVYHNPYGQVDWAGDHRLLAQLHCHVGTSPDRILAYDAAGYDVLSLMTYSGNPAVAQALSSRPWPPEDVLPASLFDDITKIGVFIANGEEVGFQHITSPFMTGYIERRGVPQYAAPENTYQDTQECIDLVLKRGGAPIVAHPWRGPMDVAGLRRYVAIEIYSAMAECQRLSGDPFFVAEDRNAIMLGLWDALLEEDQSVRGVAVNDHCGPDATLTGDKTYQDSGKVVFLARERTAEAVSDAFWRGAFFALKDMGERADYPAVLSAECEGATCSVVANGAVVWISNGQLVARGSTFAVGDLPEDAKYLRFEVHAQEDVLIGQPLWVRPVGDVNGDSSVDNQDDALCGVQGWNPGHERDDVSRACAER